MKAPRHVLLILLTVSVACAAEPWKKPVKGGAVDTGPGTLTAARQYLEGHWLLESFEIYRAGKPVLLKGTGTLVYDAYGNLKMEVRADQSALPALQAAGITIKDGVVSTEGRTVVDMQHRTLSYVLENQPPGLGPLALNRLRYWEVAGTLLTLTTKDDSGNPAAVSKWRKQS
jgi:hypothetical protein